jgi:hypothetical protein
LEEKENVSQCNLAGEAFFTGSVLFTQVKAFVSLKHHCIAAKTSEGCRNQVGGDAIHLGNQNGFIPKMKFANTVCRRIEIMFMS